MPASDELAFEKIETLHSEHVFQFIPHPESSFFKGHFPGSPIVPGILLIEVSMRALATVIDNKNFDIFSGNLKKIHFKQPVLPNDNVTITITTTETTAMVKGRVGRIDAFSFMMKNLTV